MTSIAFGGLRVHGQRRRRGMTPIAAAMAVILLVSGVSVGACGDRPASSTSVPGVTGYRTGSPAASIVVALSPTPDQMTAPIVTPTSSGVGTWVTVLSVTDGDTLVALVAGVHEPLRLIGINAPEKGECLASRAADRLADLVGSGPVLLVSDVSDRDRFKRLLRYVYANDVFVNEALVGEGLAIARRYEPDTAMAGRLERHRVRARSQRQRRQLPGVRPMTKRTTG